MAHGPVSARPAVRPGQGGYALLLALAVLFGMLAMVLPLVRMNNDQIQVTNDQMDDARGQWIAESGRNMAKFMASQGSGRSRLQRQSLLPGWEGYPIRMRLRYSMDDAIKTVAVPNILPFFMQMARQVGVLKDSILLTEAPSVDPPASSSGYSEVLMIIDSELIRDKTHRGQGGVLEPHRAGAYVYAVPNQAKEGYLRIDNEWMFVSDYQVATDPSGKDDLRNGYFSVVRGVAGSAAVAHTVPPLLALPNVSDPGPIVEFFPAYPFLKAGTIEGYVRVDIEDERSRINLNSLSAIMDLNILGTSGDLWKQKHLNASAPRLFPLAHPDGALQCLNLNSPPSLRDYVLSISTVYSEPDYKTILEACGANISLPTASAPVIGIANTTPVTVTFANDAANRVFTHPVNFNQASVSVMTEVLTHLGAVPSTNVLGLNKVEAGALATTIEHWRSGEMTRTDYYDGYEDPFDGCRFPTRDDSSTTRYGSAEEEFLACVKTALDNLLAGQVQRKESALAAIRRHVYYYRSDDFYSQDAYTAPIVFETGNVKRLESSVGMMRGKGPGVVKRETVVFKDITQSTSATGIYDVTLDTVSGNCNWNEPLSTFHGLSVERPVCQQIVSGSTDLTTKPLPALPGSMDFHLGGNVFTAIERTNADSGSSVFATLPATAGLLEKVTGEGIPVDCGLHLAPSRWYESTKTLTIASYTIGPPKKITVLQSSASVAAYPPTGILTISAPSAKAIIAYSTRAGQDFFFDSFIKGDDSTLVNDAKVNYYPYKAIRDSFRTTLSVPATMPWNDHIVANTSNLFYETVLLREQATWMSFSLIGCTLPNATQVSFKLRQADNFSTLGGGIISADFAILDSSHFPASYTSDTLFIRIAFNDIGSYLLLESPSPQVFGLQAAYGRLGNAGPTRVVLNNQ